MRLAIKDGVRGGSALDRICSVTRRCNTGRRNANQFDCGNAPAPVFVTGNFVTNFSLRLQHAELGSEPACGESRQN